MKWISLIFATASMAALGWLVWQLTAAQERRAERKAAEARALESDGAEPDPEPDSKKQPDADVEFDAAPEPRRRDGL